MLTTASPSKLWLLFSGSYIDSDDAQIKTHWPIYKQKHFYSFIFYFLKVPVFYTLANN